MISEKTWLLMEMKNDGAKKNVDVAGSRCVSMVFVCAAEPRKKELKKKT